MQQAVLPVRDGLAGGTIWRGLAIGNLIPWVDVQTIKNTGGRPRLLWRGFPVLLTADSTGRTIPELKRAGQEGKHLTDPDHQPARGESGQWLPSDLV